MDFELFLMKEARYWDETIRKMPDSHLEKHIASYKAKEHLNLVNKWMEPKFDTALKTDLFEECFERDSFFSYVDCNELYGIDISEEAVKQAKTNFKSLRLQRADIRDMPFEDEKFDLIISNSTLDHMPLKELPKAIKEMKRTLKDQGTLIITIDNKHNLLYYFGLFLGQKLGFLPFYQDRCYSKCEIEFLLEEQGLKVVDIDAIFHVTPPISTFLRYLERINKKLAGNIAKYVVDISMRISELNENLATGRLLCFKVKKR